MSYFTTIVEEESLFYTWCVWAGIGWVVFILAAVLAVLKYKSKDVNNYLMYSVVVLAMVYIFLSSIWWTGMAVNRETTPLNIFPVLTLPEISF
jgi:hypothetical protein